MNNEEIKKLMNGNLSLAGTPQGAPTRQAQPQIDTAIQSQQYDVKSIAENDIKTIQSLVKSGIIGDTQGQYLVNYVINKAYDMVKNQTNGNVQQVQPDGINEFVMENKEFFNTDGRGSILDYLKNSGAAMDKDEVSKISQMVEGLEQSAVDRYLKQIAREKTLNDENEMAKQRLRANAQNSSFDETQPRVFTREQIGKMSGAEFAKYEKAIMEQLRKGLIR